MCCKNNDSKNNIWMEMIWDLDVHLEESSEVKDVDFLRKNSKSLIISSVPITLWWKHLKLWFSMLKHKFTLSLFL